MYRRGLAIVESNPVQAVEDATHGLIDEITSTRSRFFAYVGLQPVPIGLADAAAALLLAVYLLAVSGIRSVIRARRDLLAHVFVLGVAAYVLLVSAGPEAIGGRGERFRAVVMPILIVYAAAGAIGLGAHLRLAGRERVQAWTPQM